MSGVGKVKFNFNNLKDFHDKVNRLSQAEIDLFLEACAKELAARLLAKVIKRTPVGDYSKAVEVVAKRDSKNHSKGDTYTKKVNVSGKMGGTLRRGWTAGKSSNAVDYANSLRVNHFGDTFVIEIVNPVEYAPYVEFGHRTKNHKGWVRGKFMLTISEQELQAVAPAILQRKLAKKLGECFK